MTTGLFLNLKKLAILPGIMLASLMLAAPANAQFGDGYNFIKAIKDRDLVEAEKLINDGPTIVNTRDSSTRKTALHFAIEDRYLLGTRYLLQRGANPDHTDRKGVTPMTLAIRMNFVDGVENLIRYKADVNGANRSGETPLIIAVQLNKPQIVRMLMKAGADPNITDNVAGLSARDYAERDRRKKKILAILDGKETEETASDEEQGELDFSGIGEAN